jgi:peptidoglycan/LPS O-acetylase OafA/YrhL
MNVGSKIQYLEGVRGTAAFLVIIHHFLLGFYPSCFNGKNESIHLGSIELSYFRNPLSFLTNGDFMLTLFFVLSGFVLSYSYFNKIELKNLIPAAIRRFIRLYIPVACTLIIAFVLLRFSLYYNQEVKDITKSQWLASQWNIDHAFNIFLTSLLYKTMFLRDNSYCTTLWTMSIELFGSLIIFSLLALTNKIRAKWIILLFVTAISIFINAYFLAFMLGIMLYYLNKIILLTALQKKIIVPLFLIAGLIMGGFLTWYHIPKESFYYFATKTVIANHAAIIHILGSTLLIAAFLISPAMQKMFSRNAFTFLGDISFSLYLIHPLIIGTLSCKAFLTVYNSSNDYNFSTLITLLVTVFATIAIAKTITVLVDKPGIRLSKYVYNKFRKEIPE